MALTQGAQLFGMQPYGAHDTRIEPAPGLVRPQFAAECEAHIGHAGRRCGSRLAPAINAHQFARPELPGRFLQRLARAALDQGLPRFEVPGRLVIDHAAFVLFLDQQELSVPFYHRGHGDAGARLHD